MVGQREERKKMRGVCAFMFNVRLDVWQNWPLLAKACPCQAQTSWREAGSHCGVVCTSASLSVFLRMFWLRLTQGGSLFGQLYLSLGVQLSVWQINHTGDWGGERCVCVHWTSTMMSVGMRILDCYILILVFLIEMDQRTPQKRCPCQCGCAAVCV